MGTQILTESKRRQRIEWLQIQIKTITEKLHGTREMEYYDSVQRLKWQLAEYQHDLREAEKQPYQLELI